jgi:hypothetical protein
MGGADMTGPGHEMIAGTGIKDLRASHADREQAIDALKAAFVQGRLAKDEFDLRVGEALAARTYGELAPVTADIPAGLAGTRMSKPAWAATQKPVANRAASRVIMLASALYVGMWVYALSPKVGDKGLAFMLLMTFTFSYLVTLAIAGSDLASQHRQRSGRSRPPGQIPRGGGPQLRSGMPAGQLPPVGDGRRTSAEAARRARPCRGRLALGALIWASASGKARSARPRKSAHCNRPTLLVPPAAVSMVPVIV